MDTKTKKIYSILHDFFTIKNFETQRKEFSHLCKTYGLSNIFNIISEYFPYQYLLALYQAMPSRKPGEIKNIVFVVESLGIGGIERVTAILADEFNKLEYNILVLTEQPSSSLDRKLSENIRCISIPEDNRYTFFDQITENCDIVIYQNYLSEKCYIDLLYFRFKEIVFIPCFHNLAVGHLYTDTDKYFTEDLVYPYLDALVCLSRYDQIYWKEKNVPAVYIPNPLTFDPENVPQAPLESKNIIFIGRFCPQKRPDFLFEAFQEVLKKVPDARLMMVGDSNIRLETELSAKKMGIANSVDFLGFHKDTSPFLLEASVHAMPSKFEGMPMTWIEAKAFGVPTVYTKMDYLEMDALSGAISTEKNDPKDFAEALIEILTNDQTRKKLGREARDSLNNFKTEFSIRRWQLLFEALGSKTLDKSGLTDPDPDINKKIVLDVFRDEKISALQMKTKIKSPNYHKKILKFVISFTKKYIFPPNTQRRIVVKKLINRLKALY